MKHLVLGVAAAGLLACPSPAWAGRCNQVTTVTASSGTQTTSDLLDGKGRVCHTEFIPNKAAGFAVVFDSPDDTLTHGQAQVKTEPGSATIGVPVSSDFSDEGMPYNHGIDALVYSGTLIIQWSGSGN